MSETPLTPLDHYANMLRAMADTLTDQSNMILRQARRNTRIAALNAAMAVFNGAIILSWLFTHKWKP